MYHVLMKKSECPWKTRSLIDSRCFRNVSKTWMNLSELMVPSQMVRFLKPLTPRAHSHSLCLVRFNEPYSAWRKCSVKGNQSKKGATFLDMPCLIEQSPLDCRGVEAPYDNLRPSQLLDFVLITVWMVLFFLTRRHDVHDFQQRFKTWTRHTTVGGFQIQNERILPDKNKVYQFKH